METRWSKTGEVEGEGERRKDGDKMETDRGWWREKGRGEKIEKDRGGGGRKGEEERWRQDGDRPVVMEGWREKGRGGKVTDRGSGEERERRKDGQTGAVEGDRKRRDGHKPGAVEGERDRRKDNRPGSDLEKKEQANVVNKIKTRSPHERNIPGRIQLYTRPQTHHRRC